MSQHLSLRDPADDPNAADAELLEAFATQKRLAAGDSTAFWAVQQRAEADGLEAAARGAREPALPDLRLGCGGETAPGVALDVPVRVRDVTDTVRQAPAMLAADAPLERLGLARDAGVLPTAVEATQDVGATTGPEKMLSHQLAAAHKPGMGMFSMASAEMHKYRVAAHLNPSALTEATKCANAGARVMSACAQAALALDRRRNGGRQVVTMHHVTVEGGARAVVAGNVNAGKREGDAG